MTFKKCIFTIQTIIMFYIVMSYNCIILCIVPIINNCITISDRISEHTQGMLGLSWLNS